MFYKTIWVFGLTILVIGIIYISSHTKEPIKISQKHKSVISHEKTTLPIHIFIPRVGINTDIVEAPIRDGTWTISEVAANHGVGSALPGKKGNVVIFAHALPTLFGHLTEIHVGDEIDITTQNSWHVYRVIALLNAKPDQVSLVSATKDERITLFTCDGDNDEERLVVIGKPIKNIRNKFVKFTSFPS